MEMKKQNAMKQAVVWGLLLLVSAGYTAVYFFKLQPMEAVAYRFTYGSIYLFAAAPLLYLSAAALVGVGVQLWAKKPILAAVRRGCVIFAVCLLGAYFIVLLPSLLSSFSNSVLNNILAHPAWFVLPGALLSVGCGKNQEA